MYEFLAAVFAIISALSVYGMIRYGFNVVFLYILVFSLVLTAWLAVVILGERKTKPDA
jgi:drug/metabolite transporter superfamily protein YnfA